MKFQGDEFGRPIHDETLVLVWDPIERWVIAGDGVAYGCLQSAGQ